MINGSTGSLLLLLLLLVAVFGSLARVLKVPYPILLVLSGIGISLLPHVPHFLLPPDVVFLVFLPPLLYSAAWTLSWREFQRNFSSIAMLAFGLVLATVVLLTWLAPHVLPGFTWQAGLLLGAVVAATDAIAATSVASRMGLPHRIVSLLEAESLVNDATGLLALQFGVHILLTGQTPGVIEGVGRFVFLTVGGVMLGLLVGGIVAAIEEFIDDGPVEIVLSVLVPYAAYVLGERAGVSGAMAVIASGMYMSRQSTSFMSAQVRLQATAVWDALTFVLNGVIFLLLGLQLPFVLAEIRTVPLHFLLLYGAGFSLCMIALRVIWVFLDAWLARARALRGSAGEDHAHFARNKRELAVVGWGGMRGVLSLAAAVSLPLVTSAGPFRQRSFIIFLAFCLIVATLVVQGLSLPLLIRKLGLSGHAGLRQEEQGARRILLEEALNHLQLSRTKDVFDKVVLHELVSSYQGQLDAIPQQGTRTQATGSRQQRHKAILEVLEVERAALLRLRDEQTIDDEVLRTLQRELDLQESRVHTFSA